MNTMLKKTPLLLALLVPSVAWAEGTVLMAPLIPKGVDAKVSTNITSLLSSELDFSGNYDAVKELPSAPPTLTAACLAQTTCLGGIARANGVDAVVAGTVGPGTQGLQLFLVLYDARKNVIVRRKTFEASSDSSTLATAATSYINELVTGQSPSQAREEEAATVAAFNDTTSVDDDFAFEASEPPPKPTSSGKTTATPRTKVATTVAPRPLEDEGLEFDEPEQEEAYLAQKRAAEEEARRAEEERRLAAEAAARAQAEAERKAREEAARLAREEAERKAREEAARLAREEAERKAREEAARAAAAKAAASRSSSTASRSASDDEDFSFGSAANEIDIEFGSSASGIVMEVEDDEEDLDDTPSYPRSSGTKSSVASSSVRTASTASRGTTSSSSSRSSVPDFDEDEGETLSRSSSSRSGSSSRYATEEDEEEEPRSSIRDFDEEEPRASSSRTSSSTSRTTVSRAYDEDEEEPRSSIRDFDEEEDEEPRSTASRSSSSSRYEADEPRSTSSRSSSSSSYRSSSSSSRDEDERRSSVRYQKESDRGAVTITPRAGYARFYDFNFVTYGAELGVPVAPTAVLMVGVEGFSTQRELSEEVIEELSKIEGVPPSEINANPWNTILPVNLGIQYKSPGEGVKPYAGADVTVTPYTADFDVAFGARARVGADFMVADVFGFNLNLGAGIMSGSKFEQIQAGTKNTGLLPQVSAGTVFAF